jgi:purine-binding chemotaxis protein CheW
MKDLKQICSFYVDGLFFGIEVCVVQEVIRYQQMTRVPLATNEIGGLINLRGQIISAIDLRHRLGLSARPADAWPMNVIIRTDDGAVSLLVDEVGDVMEVSADDFEPAPETLTGFLRQSVQGVYKLKGSLLLILDANVVVSLDASQPAAEAA